MKYCASQKKQCCNDLVIINSACCPPFPPIVGPTGPTATGVFGVAAGLIFSGILPPPLSLDAAAALLPFDAASVLLPGGTSTAIVAPLGGGIVLNELGVYELYAQVEVISPPITAVTGFPFTETDSLSVLLEILVNGVVVVEAEQSVDAALVAGGVTTGDIFTPTFAFLAQTLTLNASTLYNNTAPNTLVTARVSYSILSGTGTSFPIGTAALVDPAGTRLFAYRVA